MKQPEDGGKTKYLFFLQANEQKQITNTRIFGRLRHPYVRPSGMGEEFTP